MRRLPILACIAGALACIAGALACGGSSSQIKPAGTAQPAPTTIEWGFGAGNRTVVTTVQAGALIQWRSTDGTHTVLPDEGPTPGSAGPGRQGTVFGTQTVTAAPGTYGYHCSIHPSMRGKLIVQ